MFTRAELIDLQARYRQMSSYHLTSLNYAQSDQDRKMHLGEQSAYDRLAIDLDVVIHSSEAKQLPRLLAMIGMLQNDAARASKWIEVVCQTASFDTTYAAARLGVLRLALLDLQNLVEWKSGLSRLMEVI